MGIRFSKFILQITLKHKYKMQIFSAKYALNTPPHLCFCPSQQKEILTMQIKRHSYGTTVDKISF